MDRIEKKVVLRAPRERVWNAVADARNFGTWFGVDFDGDFAEGRHMTGLMRPTKVDDEVAKSQEAYKGMTFEFWVDRIEPMNRISFRWHPFAIDPDHDYSDEPTTLIVFELSDAPEGTLLTITESGFDKVPLARRAEAFRMNEGGWNAQMRLIQKYVEQHAAR